LAASRFVMWTCDNSSALGGILSVNPTNRPGIAQSEHYERKKPVCLQFMHPAGSMREFWWQMKKELS
jgi:hypothetical protein